MVLELFPMSMSSGVLEVVGQKRIEASDLAKCIRRHVCGDWGDLDAYDHAYNDQQLRNGGRILSRYEFTDERGKLVLYIITNLESRTTDLMLSTEYG